MTEEKRLATNKSRLGQCDPVFARKARAVIADLEAHGERPLVATGYRSPAEQQKKVAQGFSKVRYSYHNCTAKDGTPQSLAVDIVDAEKGWECPKRFWMLLTASAWAHGLDSGIMWGCSLAERARIKAAIDARKFDANLPLGWDTAHIQVRGIPLAAARLGVRPKG